MLHSPNFKEVIILIGPMKTGKTTVGGKIAKQLGQTFTSLDKLEHEYAEFAGFDETFASKIKSIQGDLAWYSYRRQFFDEAVARFLLEHNHGVLELGGGHPILPDNGKQLRVNRILEPYHNVVLLMPVADVQESLAILKHRQKPERLHPDLNELFLQDNRFFDLAKQVVFTHGKSPGKTCQEILDILGL
jgi:shikimate kinase